MAAQFIATKMEKKKAAIKFHAAWNVTHEWIEEFQVTGYRSHDVVSGKRFKFSSGKTYVFDRSYVDLSLWMGIASAGGHFVTRLKKHGQRLKYIHDAQVDNESTGILYDKEWTPSDTICYPHGVKPKTIFYRHVIYRDPTSKMLFDFVTSDFESEAIEIANIYRQRWAVELLFRWLKGHLNIRRMGYKNLNAIKINLAIAVVVQLLTRANMLKSGFKGTNWDYLRSIRNCIDRLFYQTLMNRSFPVVTSIETLPIAGISP